MRTPLKTVKGLGSAKDGTSHFWHQRLTAVANVPLTLCFVILVFMMVGRSHAELVELLSNPLAAVLLAAFIINVLIHMRLGMQIIIEDYVHGEISRLLCLIGNTFFTFLVGAFALYALIGIQLTN